MPKTILPERFVLTVRGKLWHVRERSNIVPDELPHLLAHLVNGRALVLAVFHAHRLEIEVEEDTDQADDGPDALSLPRTG